MGLFEHKSWIEFENSSFIKYLLKPIFNFEHKPDVVQSLGGLCVIDAGCSTSLGLYCNLTGQDTLIFNGTGSLKPGKCYCKPYFYFGSLGCVAQLTINGTCNPLAYPGQCLSESDLYCDSTYLECLCVSNYYWSSTTSKCCMQIFRQFLIYYLTITCNK